MSRQWDAVAALRARAATAAGWDSTWPVAYARKVFNPPANRTWIEEAIGGGPGIPVAITPPNLVTYRFTGTWTLTLISPTGDGEKTAMDMADLLQTTLLSIPTPVLPGNIPLLIEDVELGPAIPEDGDVRRQLIVRYAFYANASGGSITIAPESLMLPVAASGQLAATAYDGGGNLIPGATFTWATANPAIATVDVNTGVVTAVALGNTTITATRNGITAQAAVVVANVVYGP